MPTFKDLLDLLLSVYRWVHGRRNPAYLQAARILQALAAHGVKSTQINGRLPEPLRMAAMKWSTADDLKEVLTQPHIDWLATYLNLELSWIEGEHGSAHKLICSYKSPQTFHKWLIDHRPPYQGLPFKLYLLTADKSEIDGASTGPFAVVLEAFGDEAQPEVSRYYHLTEGARLDHRACVLHLMQLLAIANCHQVMVQRSILPISDLVSLCNHQGFIPSYLNKCRPHPLEADHEFWGHFSGESAWLKLLRIETKASLLNAGLGDLVSVVDQDRKRYG